ncbi:hypothetical protein GJAV_G00025600 [Gymnothorax javanicus]|nr:hypothetical protein GJAV_G00025600 [Gymnothorax javanicus]
MPWWSSGSSWKTCAPTTMSSRTSPRVQRSRVKQKTEIISRLEDKTNQMAATIKRLEQRSRQAERERDLANEANRLFKQEFGDKIESLQLEVEQLRRQRHALGMELKRERELKGSTAHIDTPTREKLPPPPQRDVRDQMEDIRKELEAVKKENDQLRTVLEKESLGSNTSLSQTEDDQDQSLTEDVKPSMCNLCEDTDSLTRTKRPCENCGEVFCESCLANELPLPSSINPVRVCNTCHSKLLQQYASGPS